MATMAAVLRRYQAAEAAQVERARRRVEAERDAEAAVTPTAERVDQAVRGAMAGHLGRALTVRLGRSGRGETVTAQLTGLYQYGALGRTGRGMPVWLPYRDLYISHAVVLEPAGARGSVQRAVTRLRRGAPRGDAR